MLKGSVFSVWLVQACFAGLLLALLCAFVRVVRGPTMPDRVVAIDLLSAVIIGIIALYSIMYNVSLLLDVAIGVALITFLGTVAFALYIERKAKDD